MHWIMALIICGSLAVVNGAFAQDNLKALYEKAKKEGQVVIAAGSPPAGLKAQFDGFNKRFPGIQVNHIPSTGADATTKILVESRVGMATYEVGQATTATGERLLAADLVSKFPLPRVWYRQGGGRIRATVLSVVRPFLCARVQHQAGLQGSGAQELGRDCWTRSGRAGRSSRWGEGIRSET